MLKKRIKKGQQGLVFDKNGILNSEYLANYYKTGLSDNSSQGPMFNANYFLDKYKNTNYLNTQINPNPQIPDIKTNNLTKGISGFNIAGSALGIANAVVPSYDTSNNTTNAINNTTSTIANTLSAIPEPHAQAAGYLMQGMSLGKKGLDNITKGKTNIKNASGIDSVLNSDLAWMFSGTQPLALANSLTSKEITGTDNSLTTGIKGYTPTESIETSEVGGLTRGFNAIKKLFTGKDKLADKENKVNSVNYDNFLKQKISSDATKNTTLANNSYRDYLSKNMQALSGQKRPILAKTGTKLPDLQKLIVKVKKGASMNVIPDGKLHSRINSHGEDLTNKGIPVISHEKGKIIQHAEIEKDELILNKENTQKVETLWKEFNNTEDLKEKNLISIKVGKLLTSEILENTQDNTGLLDK